MAQKIFINLPVKNLNLSISFFTKLGFPFDHKIKDEIAACMIIRDNLFVMLLKDVYFKTFVGIDCRRIQHCTEVFITIEAVSKNHIQNMISLAMENGAITYSKPEDHGWMYQHGFIDLDGHHWEFIYTDKNLMPDQF